MAALPLQRHLAFETRDLDEARERVARVFCPHRLDTLRPRRRIHARQHVARLGNLALSYIAYGAEVEIDPGKLASFFLIHLIHSGRSEIRIGDRALVASPSLGSVTSATLPLRMRWSADCAHVVLKIDRPALERHLADLLGSGVTRPIEFEPELPAAGRGAGYRRLVDFVSAELERDDSLLASPLGIAGIEQTLMTALLIAQPSNYSEALAAQASPAAPRHVARAEDYIRAHAASPVTVGALAAASGVSARTLFEGFRRFRGTTPMALLKSVRLERAHAELKSAATATSVTDVALKWGFVHLGRFAQDYRKRFGKLPSETRRR